MKDGKPNISSEPDGRRGGNWRGGPKRQRGFVERATATGHSGHGSESVRPHLRDQLKLKALMPQPFPTPPEAGKASNDDYHR
jgi:hypothetical protein